MLVGHLFFIPLSTSYLSSPCLWGTFSSFLCLPPTHLPHACGAPFLHSSVYLLLVFPMLVRHLFFFPLSTSYSSSPCLWGTFSSFLCLPLTCLPHACGAPFLVCSVYPLLVFPMLVGHLFLFPLFYFSHCFLCFTFLIVSSVLLFSLFSILSPPHPFHKSARSLLIYKPPLICATVQALNVRR